jgi:hypothetical protein
LGEAAGWLGEEGWVAAGAWVVLTAGADAEEVAEGADGPVEEQPTTRSPRIRIIVKKHINEFFIIYTSLIIWKHKINR